MSRRAYIGVALGVSLWPGLATADQDSDLDLIPAAAPATSAAPAAAPGQRVYLENAVTGVSHTGDLAVPLPGAPGYTWQERLLLDVRTDSALGEHTSLVFSDRFNLRDESDLPFPDHADIINDLREAYLSWRPSDALYLDAGRINLKSGIALGYNPTDFFRNRTVSEPLSLDPSTLREDRLGTLMLRAQHIGESGSLLFAVAPGIHQPSPIYSNADLPSFNPMFDRTNSSDRFLLKGSVNLGDDWNPEFLLYHGEGQTRLGTNFSLGLGQSSVAYLEWSGGERKDLISEAMDYGRATGTLPPNAPSPLPTTSHETFKSELAAGASYTTANDITFNLEYLVNQAGFSRADWDAWFAAGRGQSAASPLLQELWYIRSYARDQQQQNSRSAYFARMDWVDAFGLKLEISGFVLADAYDGSGLAQLSADYYLSERWTLGGLGLKYFGSARSEFGSLGTSYSVLLHVTHYF